MSNELSAKNKKIDKLNADVVKAHEHAQRNGLKNNEPVTFADAFHVDIANTAAAGRESDWRRILQNVRLRLV